MKSGRSDDDPSRDDLVIQIDQASRQLELANPDIGLPTIDRIINRIAEVIGVTLLASVLSIVFVNAFTRYAFNTSLIWGEEVVTGLIPWLAMVGLFLSARRRQMIRIEFFLTKLPVRMRSMVNAAGQLLCAAIFAYLAWVALDYVQIFGRDPTPYLGLPKGLSTSALVVGGVIVSLAFIAGLLRELASKRGDRK